MRNKIPHPPELAKFRTLYLDFAKTMLEMTNKQYMDDGAEKLLIQEYQLSGDDYEPYRDLRRLDSLNQATLACS